MPVTILASFNLFIYLHNTTVKTKFYDALYCRFMRCKTQRYCKPLNNTTNCRFIVVCVCRFILLQYDHNTTTIQAKYFCRLLFVCVVQYDHDTKQKYNFSKSYTPEPASGGCVSLAH